MGVMIRPRAACHRAPVLYANSSCRGAGRTPSAPTTNARSAHWAFRGQNGVVPLVDVMYSDDVSDDELRCLAQLLPDLIAEAVACPEETWTGPAGVGDIEIRFRPRGDFDIGELRFVIEVRTKLFASRLDDKQCRADLVPRSSLGARSRNCGRVGPILQKERGARPERPWAPTSLLPTCHLPRVGDAPDAPFGARLQPARRRCSARALCIVCVELGIKEASICAERVSVPSRHGWRHD